MVQQGIGVLYGIVWYCMLLYSFVWYCMVQQEGGGRLWNISNIKFLELLLYAATRPAGLHISDSFTQIQRKIEIQRTIEIQMQYLGNISNYFTKPIANTIFLLVKLRYKLK